MKAMSTTLNPSNPQPEEDNSPPAAWRKELEELEKAGKVALDPFWGRDIQAVIQDLETEIRREERRRYSGLDPETLSLEEVGAALWVSDHLREQGILEVTPEKMRELIDDALRRGLGYGTGGGTGE